MQAVRNKVDAVGHSNIWLAGHSLGSAIAMLVGIKDDKTKDVIRTAGSFLTTGAWLALDMIGNPYLPQISNQFFALSPWVPYLFVTSADHICSEYIGYFEHRQRMEDMRAEGIERLATQNSLSGLFMNAIGRESEPLHILPSGNLTVNLSQYPGLRQAHKLQHWSSPSTYQQSKLYHYK
ncbi:hypothetical protein GIB67_001563 [Kingdonia uniflora]|uniref:Fungal lipase-like domain-containing protein n=1 Tax=Kingdonia uniflora TaxID=39325 RepID=A0A7J7L0T6_9MAGN|nr:hypothetical protein GIB67_001563 [Kingdonia uniflora]